MVRRGATITLAFISPLCYDCAMKLKTCLLVLTLALFSVVNAHAQSQYFGPFSAVSGSGIVITPDPAGGAKIGLIFPVVAQAIMPNLQEMGFSQQVAPPISLQTPCYRGWWAVTSNGIIACNVDPILFGQFGRQWGHWQPSYVSPQ